MINLEKKQAIMLWGLISAATLLLIFIYIQFLWSPLFFDDQYLFLQIDEKGTQVIDSQSWSWLGVRSHPYASFAWTKLAFGTDLIYFRLGNLALHVATSIALFGLLRSLFSRLYQPQSSLYMTATQAAALGAVLFSLHPLATYAVGYLVQRTIVMATLFSLLAMWVYIKGSIQNNFFWMWCCVPLYYLAVFSKEHAIMLPAALLALTILLHPDWLTRLRQRWTMGMALGLIGLQVVLIKMSYIGTAYELEAPAMLGVDLGPLAYPLSVITQCTLFFKYVFLWLLPQTAWTSIDMREPFARSLASWQLLGVAAYIAWGIASIVMLFKRGRLGLAGFAMFFPWVMFFSELATVRIQEPFVLYRSYLWFGMGVVALPMAFAVVHKKWVLTIAFFVCILFSVFTLERLATFSHPFLVWEDAKKLLANKSDLRGQERIYYNLAREQYMNDFLEPAQHNIKIALSINPKSEDAHSVLGAIYLKSSMWHHAVDEYTLARDINIKSGKSLNARYLMGRAKAYEGAGELKKAADDYLEACRINFNICEMLRKEATVLP